MMSRLGPVTDDRPDGVPVADAELDVFEAWFGSAQRAEAGSYTILQRLTWPTDGIGPHSGP